jgi:aminoglycoside phosphotransferase family enzyme/predicted kinase
MAGQESALAILADPANYGGETPIRIDTHISTVFLAGNRAYKLKRAVVFPFLDFSTIDKREAACRAELAVNRRWAPDLYLGVEPVKRSGSGEILDWVVAMRRFDGDELWDARASRGRLDAHDMRLLADVLAASHDAAETVPDHGGVADLDWTEAGDRADLAKLFDPAAVDALDVATRAEIVRHRRLIEARRADGSVRRCHGDLHLRNICTVDGAPVPFDGIEFDDRISCIDALFDLAFPLVDLARIGRRDLANALLARYLQRRPDEAGLALLPLFQSLRAAIVAKTRGFAARAQTDPARAGIERAASQACFDLAKRFLSERPAPRLVAVGGLSGSGKSGVAAHVAPSLGPAPGAVVLRSDVERKRLAGVAPEKRLPEDGYTKAASKAVYEALFARARLALTAGHSVVLDAVFADLAERASVRDLAGRMGVNWSGLWLDCPDDIRRARIAGRRGDASDADETVADWQSGLDLGAIEWRRVDAGGSPEVVFAAARAAIEAGQSGTPRTGVV